MREQRAISDDVVREELARMPASPTFDVREHNRRVLSHVLGEASPADFHLIVIARTRAA